MSRIYVCNSGHRWDADKLRTKPGQSAEVCPWCGQPGFRQARAGMSVPTPPPIPGTRPAKAVVPKPASFEMPAAPVEVPASHVEPAPAPVAATSPASVDTTPSWAKVELPPSLPMCVFVSTERWNEPRMGALALYCSDGRWGDAFDEFCHRSLNIPRYDRFAVPGGPGWIVQAAAEGGTVAEAAKMQLDYLVKGHDLDRIVLITHFSCGYYRGTTGKEGDAALPRQYDDVKKAGAILRDWFKIKVEGYLAMRTNTMMSFHRLET